MELRVVLGIMLLMHLLQILFGLTQSLSHLFSDHGLPRQGHSDGIDTPHRLQRAHIDETTNWLGKV